MLGRVTLGGVADLYKQAVIYGLPLDYWQRYPDMLASLTAHQAQAAAAQYLAPDRFVTVAVGEPKSPTKPTATAAASASARTPRPRPSPRAASRHIWSR
jgi:predicted Zn-dependent peptidase